MTTNESSFCGSDAVPPPPDGAGAAWACTGWDGKRLAAQSVSIIRIFAERNGCIGGVSRCVVSRRESPREHRHPSANNGPHPARKSNGGRYLSLSQREQSMRAKRSAATMEFTVRE